MITVAAVAQATIGHHSSVQLATMTGSTYNRGTHNPKSVDASIIAITATRPAHSTSAAVLDSRGE
ncbi:MAG: hypothetical protein RLW62_15315, partial [Gammaproteobacteria bacterium]